MPQVRRNAVDPAVRRTVRLSPVPDPSHKVVQDQSPALLKALEKIGRNGGTFHSKPPAKPYAFPGGTHLAISDEVHQNLWRFELTPMARHLLDHFTAAHDEDGIVTASQQELGRYFGCHHSKISRAIKLLDQHNFAWKARQKRYQLNPLYAYRWGSERHRALSIRLKKVLAERQITPPLKDSEMRNR